MSKKNKGRKDGVVAENRRARHDYAVEETFEAGLALVGTEVKSLREGQANIAESYVSPEGGELWLINADIPEYAFGNRFNHEPRRKRKLLMHRREIDRLTQARERRGMTIVPLKMYFNGKGIVKLLIGLAKGKKAHDKRETEKKRDWQRQKARLLRQSR
ncbi:MAG TPA: SsrA-binding protein SmpB [Thermopetrobacter sp.]|nr:SsrA-binding protein SmpB [Thermopetrobacter sp.]